MTTKDITRFDQNFRTGGMDDKASGFFVTYADHVKAVEKARDDALVDALEISLNVSDDGQYHGESSVDSASGIYQQGAYEVYELILALRTTTQEKPNE
jgi:hypothetical protein